LYSYMHVQKKSSATSGTYHAGMCKTLAMARTIPARHWRSYGDDKLPTTAEALNEPFIAFPSWFLRITCDRCGKLQIINEAHAAWCDRTLRQILARMRHAGCGGLAGRAELLSGAEGASCRPVRKIVLRE
jgi:hypothetical protein